MDERSSLTTALLVGACVTLLLPYLLMLYLRIKLRKARFRATVGGLFTYTNVRFAAQEESIPVQIECIRLSYERRKIILCVNRVEVDLTTMDVVPRTPPPRVPPPAQGGLFALLIRILLLFFAEHAEIQVQFISVCLPWVSLSGADLRLSLQIDHTNAESKISLSAAPLTVLIGRKSTINVGPLGFDMLLPTSVSMTQSFRKSLCRLNIQAIGGYIDIEELFQVKVLPGTRTEVQEYEDIILPKRTSIDIGQCQLRIGQSEFNASGLYGLLNAKHQLKIKAEAKGMELKYLSETLACVPALDVDITFTEKGLEIGYSADFLYLAACKSLADFTSGCIPVRTPMLRTSSEPATPIAAGTWTQSIHITNVKLALFDEEGKHELLQGEILDLRLVLTKREVLNVSITCTSAEVDSTDTSVKVLSVGQPDVLIQPRHVDFSCTKTVAHWVRSLHELCYPPILSIVRSFTSRHRCKWRTGSPAKDVNLDFANVSVTFTFAPEEGLRAEVARFQTDILRSEKLLRLCFSRSTLFAKEQIEKLILTCQDLTVDKKYIEKEGEIVAKIDVTGSGTDLSIPAKFPWGRAIFKSVISIVGGIKWTMSFLFPGVVRKPHIVFMEKAVTDLTLTDVRLIIMDDEMNTVVRRKLLVNPENDIYPQLRSIQTNPMFVLTFQTTRGFFGTFHSDNTRLCSSADALSALQDLDYFEIPPESYFSFIMANDLHMVFTNAACEFRDYPWKLYRISTLTLKGRSMINKNRLPLHNWARWKIHSKVNIGLEGVQFTLGLCLRSALFDVNS